jgi:hypothetical protein
MNTTYYVKFLRSGSTLPVMSGRDELEAVHAGLGNSLRYARSHPNPEDVLVFAVNLETRLVTYWGTTFIKDPDNDPFYVVRTIMPTDYDTVKAWTYDDFMEHMEEILGNFESGAPVFPDYKPGS